MVSQHHPPPTAIRYIPEWPASDCLPASSCNSVVLDWMALRNINVRCNFQIGPVQVNGQAAHDQGHRDSDGRQDDGGGGVILDEHGQAHGGDGGAHEGKEAADRVGGVDRPVAVTV